MNLFRLSATAIALAISTPIVAAPALGSEDIEARRQGLVDAANVVGILSSEMILQKGNPNAAFELYKRLLSRTNDPAVAQRAFDLALILNQLDQAQEILNKWQSIESNTASNQLKEAKWNLALLQNKPEAWQMLPEMFKQATEDQVARYFLVLTGYVDSNTNNIKRNYQQLEKIAKNYPEMPEAALCLTAYATVAQDQQGVVKHLKKMITLIPTPNAESQYLIGTVLQRKPEYIVSFFEKTPNDQLSLDWQRFKIETLIMQEKFAVAYQNLKEILKEQQDQASLYLEAGYLSQRLDLPKEEALAYYEKAYALGGATQDRAALLAGALSYDLKDNAVAKSWLNKVTDKNLFFDKMLFLSWIAVDEGQFEQAQQYVNQAIKMQKKGVFFSEEDTENIQLTIYQKNKQNQKYLTFIDKLIKTAKTEDRKDALLRDRSFYFSDVLGQPEKAVTDLRMLLGKQPDDPDLLNSLGYTLLFVKGHEQEAHDLIKRAYDQEPDSAAINDSLGWALFKLGQPEEALPLLEYAFSNLPNAEVSAHLGEVLWQLGRKEEARVIWEKGMEENAEDRTLLNTRKRYGVQ
ncbi:tetratricopeptide repeat protein [Neisseria sp. Ec49-e6-T10]|uniref:tetratricopeptide repeat protein n=1 Tax=Neisseria sp. Ec49-e6-T10 TaxID=3140744 RepID=UPI003EB8B62F